MKRFLALLVGGLVLVSASPGVLADGKVFPPVSIAVQPQTADQRALLHYREGVERLVIETSFHGEGTNFAWVIPLPSTPEVEAVPLDCLDGVASAFWPKLVARPARWWMFHLLVCAWLSIVIIESRLRGTRSAVRFVSISILLLFIAAIALPGYVRARGVAGLADAAAVEQVLVLQRQQVGIYDTVTLRGSSGQVLAGWLESNHFRIPTNTVPVINDYAREGWVFVAARVNRSADVPATSRPHPLAFRFQTDKPVYPLRLTGVENGDCDIELFVFGPSQATVPGFHVAYCAAPEFIESSRRSSAEALTADNFQPPPRGGIRIGRPELIRLAAPAHTATKLVGHLTPMMMRQDAYVRWVRAAEKIPVLHSRRAAVHSVVNWLVVPLATGLLFVFWRWPRWTPYGRRQVPRVVIAVAVAAALFRLAGIRTAPVVETAPLYGLFNEIRQLDGAIQQFCLEHQATNDAVPTVDELCRSLPTYLPRHSIQVQVQVQERQLMNLFSRRPVREGTAPGNLTVRQEGGRFTVCWHDINGTPVSMGLR